MFPVVDDSAGYDSSATLVDFSSSPNEVRRMPQGGPPNTTPNVPRAEARDSHAGQVDSASVQRTPTGSTREFAPSPSLENDPLADSDEPGPAGTALAPFTPDTVQRSTAVQSAIARAENPSVPDDEPDYYDPMGDDSGSSVTGAPPRREIFRSLLSEINAIHWPSGEKSGSLPFSVPIKGVIAA